jgi:hypothetical protein
MRSWPAFLLCPILSGCFAIGYPSVTETPTLVVPGSDVHAFRVTSEWSMNGPWLTAPVTISRAVEELPLDRGMIDPQHNSYFAYSYNLFPLAGGSRSRDVKVLLYRPGYELIDVPTRSWWAQSFGDNPPEIVAWKPAPDLASQEQALRRIASGSADLPRGPWGLNPQVLSFVAGEYARLAQSPLATTPETRERLQDAARRCQELALQGTTPPTPDAPRPQSLQ